MSHGNRVSPRLPSPTLASGTPDVSLPSGGQDCPPALFSSVRAIGGGADKDSPGNTVPLRGPLHPPIHHKLGRFRHGSADSTGGEPCVGNARGDGYPEATWAKRSRHTARHRCTSRVRIAPASGDVRPPSEPPIDQSELTYPGVASYGPARRAPTAHSVRYHPARRNFLKFQRQPLNFKGFQIPPSFPHKNLALCDFQWVNAIL